MKTLLQSAAVLALLCLGVGAAALAFWGVRVLKDVDRDMRHIDAMATRAEGEWQNEKADVQAIVHDAKNSAHQASLFAQEQRIQLAKTSRDSDNQVRSVALVTRNAETFFYNLDQQVNGKVLPDFDRELMATSGAAQSSFQSVTHAADSLNLQINDPAVAEMLDSFNQAARNLSLASASGTSILGHGDHVAAYYDKKLTTPVGFARTMLNFVLDTGAKAGSIFAGFAGGHP